MFGKYSDGKTFNFILPHWLEQHFSGINRFHDLMGFIKFNSWFQESVEFCLYKFFTEKLLNLLKMCIGSKFSWTYANISQGGWNKSRKNYNPITYDNDKVI